MSVKPALSLLLVNENDPDQTFFVPNDELPFDIGVTQLKVGLDVDAPDEVVDKPVILIEGTCDSECFDTPKNSAMIFVDKQDLLIKSKDGDKGETTALTPPAFIGASLTTGSGAPINILPISLSITGSLGVSGWHELSSREFETVVNGTFFKYTSDVKGPRAVKVDVSFAFTGPVGLVGAILSFAIVKSNGTASTVGETVFIGNVSIAAAILQPLVISGHAIFENVKKGDHFSLVINNGVSIAAAITPTFGTITLVSMSQGTD